MKRLLITGAAGFLGSTFAQYFSKKDWEIYGLDRVAPDKTTLAVLKDHAALRLPDPSLDELLTQWKPDACIHAAGRASVPQSMANPASDFNDGTVLTFHMLDALRRCCPDCAFVLLSSAAVYGNPASLPVHEDQAPNPISAYGYHKLQSELLCKEFAGMFGMRTSIARLFSAYGPGLRRQVLWDITQKALTQRTITLQGTGSESRDFLHVLDIARALECILDGAVMRGEVINVASGRETKIADLAQLILNHVDPSIILKFSGELPSGTPTNWQADIRKIAAMGFIPDIALDAGVANYVDWCKHEINSKGMKI